MQGPDHFRLLFEQHLVFALLFEPFFFAVAGRASRFEFAKSCFEFRVLPLEVDHLIPLVAHQRTDRAHGFMIRIVGGMEIAENFVVGDGEPLQFGVEIVKALGIGVVAGVGARGM